MITNIDTGGYWYKKKYYLLLFIITILEWLTSLKYNVWMELELEIVLRNFGLCIANLWTSLWRLPSDMNTLLVSSLDCMKKVTDFSSAIEVGPLSLIKTSLRTQQLNLPTYIFFSELSLLLFIISIERKENYLLL